MQAIIHLMQMADLLKLLKQAICDPHHIIVDHHDEFEAHAQHPFYQSNLSLLMLD